MSLQTTVLDMQPIDPPVGGGRLRLLGLYHGLGEDHQVGYVGTYDWPGPGYRNQLLSPTLREELVPLTAEHFAAAQARAEEAGGRGVIDTAFHTMAHLSPHYVQRAREEARDAEIVVFSHPWIYPLVRDVLDPDRQLIVYDAHNVEGILRTELLDDQGGAGTEVARGVIEVESMLCQAADLVLACSHEDRQAFCTLYGISPQKTRVVANGTFTRSVKPASAEEKASARDILGIEAKHVAFFLGSLYDPNVEAARFIAEVLAPALKDVLFVVAGGVGQGLDGADLPANLRITGQISEDEKHLWLQASDIAVNPMFSGSGTNIKMLDFMAAGLPIVSTETGARGIRTSAKAFLIADALQFVDSVHNLLDDDQRTALGEAARYQADRFYSWERISNQLGTMLNWHRKTRSRPFFSVVVPTYERHGLLSTLVEQLGKQTFRDFEVIIVDQSKDPWPARDNDHGFPLLYIHTDRRGAATARNTGADIASGQVIAFTDDDCQPHEDWLAAAYKNLSDESILGLEGLIRSDKPNDPEWRPVTNDGFEGIGFMTANLFVRTKVFQALNGFDIRLESPHFREDTDLGWRIQDIGEIPFSREAWVYHPPHSRQIERESLAVRSRFFQNDAILLKKHPDKYARLMLREVQWDHNPFFWEQFLEGVALHGVDVPESIRQIMRDNAGINYLGQLEAVSASPAVGAPPSSATEWQASTAPRRGMLSRLKPLVWWIVRPLWQRVWARIEGRVAPLENRIAQLEKSAEVERRLAADKIQSLETKIAALKIELKQYQRDHEGVELLSPKTEQSGFPASHSREIIVARLAGGRS